jgi:hypothetical protein
MAIRAQQSNRRPLGYPGLLNMRYRPNFGKSKVLPMFDSLVADPRGKVTGIMIFRDWCRNPSMWFSLFRRNNVQAIMTVLSVSDRW